MKNYGFIPLLEIKDLHVSMNEIPILKGLDLLIHPGEIHAIMGPNGSGKSTCAKVIAGHPSYKVTKGEILFLGKDITSMEPHERAQLGVFLGFQYPVEIPGVETTLFYERIYNTLQKARSPKEKPISLKQNPFIMSKPLKLAAMELSFLFGRGLNEGFSGGEKKRNEILQLSLLDSQLGILDEIDSGLDIDALQIVSKALNNIVADDPKKSLVLITHYKRLLEYVKPDFIHILKDGKIIKTGDATLADILEKQGYEWLNSV